MKERGKLAHDVVTTAIRGQLDRIEAAAERARHDEHDAEAVHDFRVGIRRLRTVLRAARGLFGSRRVTPIESGFCELAVATGALRDAEVLRETIEAAALGDELGFVAAGWLAKRAARHRRLRQDVVNLLAGERLATLCDEARRLAARKPRGRIGFAELADERLARERRGVRRLLPVDKGDAARLHRLRIRFKRLRYTAEMLGRFMDRADASAALQSLYRSRANYAAVARLAGRMQQALGEVHDADVALSTLRRARSLTARERLALASAVGRRRDLLAERALELLAQLPPELLGVRKASLLT